MIAIIGSQRPYDAPFRAIDRVRAAFYLCESNNTDWPLLNYAFDPLNQGAVHGTRWRAWCATIAGQHAIAQGYVSGGCIGIDTIAGRVCWREFHRPMHFVLPADRTKVASDWRECCSSSEAMPIGTNNLQRNDRTVQLASAVIALPNHLEIDRSGTWSTVRRARRKRIPTLIIYPSGLMIFEEGGGQQRALPLP